MVELELVDITTEVSMLSSCLVLSREEHLKQLFRMFSYLEKQHNSEMFFFDHTLPDVDYTEFSKQVWNNTVYANKRGELKEKVPTNLPTPLGKVLLCVPSLTLTMLEIR